MANLLKGVPVAKSINADSERMIEALKGQGITPKLSIVRVGDKEDDIYYENAAAKRCAALGVCCELIHFASNVTQELLEDEVKRLNSDDSVSGVLILRPLPAHIDSDRISELLCPDKDVDGITPFSLYCVFSGQNGGFVPCTARACLETLKYYGIPLSGKRAVVIGRSLVIGKPVSMLLLKENATVTVCHTKTVDLYKITREADIIVTSAGKVKSLTERYVSGGQTVIDVSMNTDDDGNICGDADFPAVSEIVDNITPVPGGIGSVTTAILINNTVKAALNINSKTAGPEHKQ